MIVVVMGVAGSGKTTISRLLAQTMECSFLEGDSLHSDANVAKMSQGLPLTDADRGPWLAAVHAEVRKAFVRGEDLVVACSALKQAYRALLAGGIPVTWVHLDAPADIIRARLEHRTGHFMKANMLSSQIEALERPADAIAVDASQEPAAIVEEILARLRLRTDC
ncbi:MAG TPA: gluconokinase [Vicinamibacterales bacterium]|nr:gluconokinase [Vicinamibacterales bacterium]